MEKSKEQKELAEQILQLTEAKLLSGLRFLSGALMAASYEPSEKDLLFAADGDRIYYNQKRLLLCYRKSPDETARGMMHTLLHLLMGHPFCRQEADLRLWNLACDMASEAACMELAEYFTVLPGDREKKQHLERIGDYASGSTAEAFYNYFLDGETAEEEITVLEELFAVDSHQYWMISGKKGRKNSSGRRKDGEVRGETQSSEDEEEPAAGQEDQLQTDGKDRQEKQWKRLARQVQTELDLFNRKQGMRAGSLMAGLKPFLFEKMDYSSFLRMFASENEVLQISDDEFDPIYYMYGLRKYGNIPLIEPLEYSNLHRIREFVIAIDTSGSVQGEVVADFLRRTVQVLRQTECFTDRVNIYILQCDAKVQSCTQITDLEELSEYIRNMELYGFGGTDFRPVFEYVDMLLEEKKLRKVNGLLYFTDGVGIYPEKEPSYKTAFIFNRDDYGSPKVPEWAIKAVLMTEDIVVRKRQEHQRRS